MTDPEAINDKLRRLADTAIAQLEKRTGLSLAGLSKDEIKRKVAQWEKSQKKGAE